MKPSPQIHELPNMPAPSIHERVAPGLQPLVNSREGGYKGGRRLASSIRFEYWRTTEGLSQLEVAEAMTAYARESTTKALGPKLAVVFPPEYILTKVRELESGRFKPSTWIVFLFVETYTPAKARRKVAGPKFPWWEFYDGQAEGASK